MLFQAGFESIALLDFCVAFRYITDTNRVYVRSATKNFLDEINHVTGFTGRPTKIQVSHVQLLYTCAQYYSNASGHI